MQRKKVLALMLTAALVGQPGASLPVRAAETEVEESMDFDFESTPSAEKNLPVIAEDLPEETITYQLDEKAKTLKIKTEEDKDELKYLWLKSENNKEFSEIKRTDKEEQTESDPEYTPATDVPGTFYYKVRIWKLDETDGNAYIESRSVCVEVLDEASESAEDQQISENTEKNEQDENADSEDRTYEPDSSENQTEPDVPETGKSEDDNADRDTSGNESEEEDEEQPDSGTGPEEADSDADAELDESGGDSKEIDNAPAAENINHLPKRQSDIPEAETYETEGYWNVSLDEIFQDPDGDDLTYYEKGERDEDWTLIDGDSYLCHLKDNQETYLFTAKDQEDYGEIYALTLKKKDASDSKSSDSKEEIFSAGEAEATSAKSVSFSTAYKATGNHLAAMAEKSAPVNGAIGGEWMVIGLARSGQPVDSSVYSRYKSNLVDVVKEKKGVLDERKYSEYSRAVLALTAIGEDVTDVGGYNLLKPLADFDQTVWQGINGPIWALLAFDSHDYEVPKAASGKTQTTREKLINEILSKERSGGGWSISGSADSDVTGMALQALAPYYNSNSSVKAAVNRAVKKLSSMQLSDGTFGTMGHSTSESCSQVVAGLSAIGIDCDKDSRFVKNGKSLLQGLLSYYDGSEGFLHVAGNGYDQMATEQAYYAMTAYSRMKNGKNSLYDMTDVAIKSDKEKASEVTKLIGALPSKITVSNYQKVITAYVAYNGLNSTQKSEISKSDREKLLNAYKAAQEIQVKQVENLISGIGKVTLASEEKITEAKTAYNSLSSAQKKKVSNYSVLTAADKELQKLKKSSASPTTAAKPSGTSGGSINMVKPTATPSAGANPSRTKSAGGSTKSVSAGSGKSSKSSSKTGSSKSGSTKSKTAADTTKKKNGSDKTSSKSSTSAAGATQTQAEKKVIKEMKVFFDKKRKDPYPEKIDDYSDKQIKELGKTWKNYEKLSEGEKKTVQEDQTGKAFLKLLSFLGERYHFDQTTGTNLDDNQDEVLPWYVQMVVNPKIADENEMETIQKVLGEKSEVLSLNEIHFVDTLTGDNWKPEDILKVKLPMADLGDYESCMIVHITDEGKVEFLKGKTADGYITFDAAEFSAYGIVGFMGNSDDILSGQEETKPVWPWIAAGGAACVLVILMGGMRIAGSRKKKDKNEHE